MDSFIIGGLIGSVLGVVIALFLFSVQNNLIKERKLREQFKKYFIDMHEPWYDKLKAWYIKTKHKYFGKQVTEYPVPQGQRLYEMDLITKDIHKAEYHIINKNRILIKKPNCIYQCAEDLHHVKEKFEAIIKMSLN